ncbi:MAG: hypothetical protein E6H10_17775 [Bacteroidetes bacterium]|nr:MAG: hypothetical protein E6H10_17775 [Bacteroidota bacterium]
MIMKFYLIATAIPILLSSCLKQSIPDAMLGTSKHTKITATLSYEINGNLVNVSVDDADNQASNFHTLECVKLNGYYNLSAITDFGEFTFNFFTDSLKVGSYNYPTNSGGIYVTDFHGPNFVYYPMDKMNFNVTTYEAGHISGNFSGVLTPQVNNIWGAASSVTIKNGSFKNVPIFY